MAGYIAVIGLLAGVWRARETGVGCDVDLSLFESALSQLNYIAAWVASRGYVPARRPRSAHQSLVPFGNFPTADGWLVLACPKETLWRDLCRVCERSQWAHDPRFATFADRARHRDQLTALLDELLRERTTDEWVARLTAASIPCAPINDVGGALGDPQSIAREAVGRYEHPRLGTVRQVRTPFRLAGVDRELRPAPALGADTTAVLRELCGWDEARVARLSTVRGD